MYLLWLQKGLNFKNRFCCSQLGMAHSAHSYTQWELSQFHAFIHSLRRSPWVQTISSITFPQETFCHRAHEPHKGEILVGGLLYNATSHVASPHHLSSSAISHTTSHPQPLPSVSAILSPASCHLRQQHLLLSLHHLPHHCYLQRTTIKTFLPVPFVSVSAFGSCLNNLHTPSQNERVFQMSGSKLLFFKRNSSTEAYFAVETVHCRGKCHFIQPARAKLLAEKCTMSNVTYLFITLQILI